MNAGIGALLKGTGKSSQPFVVVEPLDSGIIVPEDGRSSGICDLNNDARPDLFVGLNNAHPSMFINQSTEGNPLAIRLKGSTANPTAIGSQVTLIVPGMPKQTAEIYGGSGYLSQSEPVLFFAGPIEQPHDSKAKLQIRWPNGSESVRDIDLGERFHLIEARF